MGPIYNKNNYGTFAVPPGCSEVRPWREGAENYASSSEQYFDPAVERVLAAETKECHLRRGRDGTFGFHMGIDGSSVIITDVGNQVR